jgi:hypothetical protein
MTDVGVTLTVATLRDEVERLRAALRLTLSKVPTSRRSVRRIVDLDESAGSTYEVSPAPWFVEIKALLGEEIMDWDYDI